MNKGKLKLVEGGQVGFYCPGCKEFHVISIDPLNKPAWTFNWDYEKPSFIPSVKVTSGHYMERHTGSCWCTYNKEHPDALAPFKCVICHSFVTDGKIQYLGDCTHELAGQTVELPDLD